MLTAADIEGSTVFPLTDLLTTEAVASILPDLEFDLLELLDEIGFTEALVQEVDNGYLTRLIAVVAGELALSPFGDVLELVLGSTGSISVFEIEAVFEQRGDGLLVDLHLEKVPVTLRVSADILRPLKPNSKEPDLSTEYLQIPLGSVSLAFNNLTGFDLEFGGGPSVPRCMIGETGVILSIGGIRWLTPSSPDLPMDVPSEFTGLFLDDAVVELTALNLDENTSLTLDYAFIGTGGFTGQIDANNLNLTGTLFELGLELDHFGLTLVQSAVSASSIGGRITLPFFDEPVDIEIGVDLGGSFTVEVSGADGLCTLTKPHILRIDLYSLGFELENGTLAVKISGKLKPLFAGFTWPEFEIKALTIDSRGRVMLDGGWIDLPKQLTMDFYGFGLEVSKIGFGSENNGDRWIGFSGGLKLCEGLPMSAAVEGLRIYWDDHNNYWLKFSGASLAFEIPNSISFSGRVALIEDGAKTGFKGSGKLKVIPTGLEINAEVIVGKNDEAPAYTFFYIYLDTQLPAGIPLFSTGASLYGLAGLFAYNMEPNKDPQAAWYEGWYKAGTPWKPVRGSFALGAGVTLGTTTDDGYAVNAKAALVLVLPGPILMIEGKAAFLKNRAKSDADMLTALAVLDNRAGQFLLNIVAEYPKPVEPPLSKFVTARAEAEAFFDFHNPNNWHLYLGQKEPREKRVRVQMLSLFESNFYLMLLPTRFEIGAWMGYDAKWKFGPLRVWLQAWIDGYALVSWKPVQFKAGLTLFGSAGLKAFGVGIELSIGAGVEVEAPTPYRVYAQLYVKMKLPWPLPDPKAEIELEWKEAGEPPTTMPLSAVGIEHLKVSEKWQLDRFSDENWRSSTPNPVVPLDAKPVLTFARPMVDAARIGWVQPGIPAPERVGDYEFEYRLSKVTLRRQPKDSSGTWEIVASRSAEDPEAGRDDLWGSWLAVDGEVPTGGGAPISPMTKLMLFAKSPFELARETIDDPYYDALSENNPGYGTSVVTPPRKVCFGFDDLVDEKKKADEDRTSQMRRGDVLIIGKNLQVLSESPDGIPYLVIRHDTGKDTGKATLIVFPEPVRQVHLFVGKSDAVCSIYHGVHPVGHRDVVNVDSTSQEIRFPDNLSKDFNLLVIDGYLELYGLCYIPAREADRFTEETETAQHAASASSAWSGDRDLLKTELLEPNSLYELEVVTKALRRRVGQGDWDYEQPVTRISHFQTAEPPGIYVPSSTGEMSPTGEEHYPERGPLRDLSTYVSKVLPLEGAQAVYRSYDVGVEFNEAYVEMMYTMAGKPLVIYLYDSNGQGIRAPDGGVPAMASSSQENVEQRPARSDREWEATTRRALERQEGTIIVLGGQEMAEAAGHPAAFSVVPQIELDATPKQTGVWGGGVGFVLKPNSLYRAVVAAMVPQVAIPLTDSGEPLYFQEQLFYYPLGGNGSSLPSAMEDSQIQHDTGMMLISDGQTSILEGTPDDYAIQGVLGNWETYQILLEETLGSSEPVTEPRAVYSWSFYTSRFATFVHHIHSFVDAAWDLRATLGSAAWVALEEGDARLVALKELIETKPDRVQDIYDRALECFGLGDRPLPERLEINVLEDEYGRYGFLVESPEPIHWKLNGPGRVSLQVKKGMEEIASPTPAYGLAKLIGCKLGEEQVTLLVQADVDLAGYRIEQVNGEGDGGVLYYEFGARSRFQAGTVLQLHVSEPPAELKAGVEQKDLYGATAEIVSEAGSTLRICDAEGREIHRRRFAPMSFVSYPMVTTDPDATRNFVLAPDADGTRTFLFLREKQDGVHRWLDDLTDGVGVYRFDWTFKRDTGDSLPLLRRCGITTAENASIEFKVPAELPDSAIG